MILETKKQYPEYTDIVKYPESRGGFSIPLRYIYQGARSPVSRGG